MTGLQSCLRAVPGCEACTRPQPMSLPHECEELCELIGMDRIDDPEFHAAYHRAQHCRKCGRWRYDDEGMPNEVQSKCRFGYCSEMLCVGCGVELYSVGPVACPCKAGWWTRLWRRLTGRRP